VLLFLLGGFVVVLGEEWVTGHDIVLVMESRGVQVVNRDVE